MGNATAQCGDVERSLRFAVDGNDETGALWNRSGIDPLHLRCLFGIKLDMSLSLLRQQLSEIISGTKSGTPGLVTGISALDAVLPNNGLPRGRLTELVGAPGSGKTTIVRQMVERAVNDGWWVAYVDAARTLTPRDWTHVSDSARDGLWVVRPRDAARGAWCADPL